MAMGNKYPFDFDFSTHTDEELQYAVKNLHQLDRDDLSSLVRELAKRLKKKDKNGRV